MALTPLDNLRRLRGPGYVVTALLIVVPLVELVLAAWPFQVGQAPWRLSLILMETDLSREGAGMASRILPKLMPIEHNRHLNICNIELLGGRSERRKHLSPGRGPEHLLRVL